jgi:hypothetical protein
LARAALAGAASAAAAFAGAAVVVVAVAVVRVFPRRGAGTVLSAFGSADRVDRRVVPRAVPGVERVPVAGTEPSA